MHGLLRPRKVSAGSAGSAGRPLLAKGHLLSMTRQSMMSSRERKRPALRKKKTPHLPRGKMRRLGSQAGGDVLSHPVTRAVPSALRGLTAVFGMGTGVAPALGPPALSGAGHSRLRPATFLVRNGRGKSAHRGEGLLRQKGASQAARAISTARLRRLPALHLPPIDVLVSNGPTESLRSGSARLGEGFALRCFQRFSRPDVATRRCPGQNSRYTRGPSVPVLSY